MSRKPNRHKTKHAFERMEPRILLSADLLGGALGDNTANSNHPNDIETLDSQQDLTQAITPLLQNLDTGNEPLNIISSDTPPISSLNFDQLNGLLSEDGAQNENVSAFLGGGNDADLGRQEIIFIDASTPDYEQLVNDITSREQETNYLIFVLDNQNDGVQQISDVLANHQEIDAIHLVSHGDNGTISLGNSELSSSNLTQYSALLSNWQSALDSGADILIYGCNLAGNESGRDLLAALGTYTGADIAASDDLTGATELGGDWDLEYRLGTVETQLAFSNQLQQQWQNTLATFTVNTTNDTIDANVGDGVALDADGNTSLRAAIMEANDDDGADIIILGSGTYNLSLGSGDDNASSGDLDIKEDLTIIGADAATTIIDAQGSDRVFEIRDSGTNVTMSNLTIQGGITGGDGGGIHIQNDNATLTADHIIVTNNYAKKGGGIFNDGTLSLTDSIISNNGRDGLSITDDGGGLNNKGEASLNRVTVSGNEAKDGAGLFQHSTANNMKLTNVTISGNAATNKGGGIYSEEIITVVNSTITLNTADSDGGGIFVDSGAFNIQNTIVSDNSSSGNGDEVYGTFNSLDYNLIKDDSHSSGFGGNDILGVSANLGLLKDNGGFGQTHALLANSAAINPAGLTGAPSVDQLNKTRDGTPDIGAVEYRINQAYESFSYGAGSLDGSNGGTGWASGWTLNSGTSAVINTTGLTNPTGTLPVTGGTAEMATTALYSQSRDLDTSLGADGTTVWFSFLLKPDDLTDLTGISLELGDDSSNKLSIGYIGNDFWLAKNGGIGGSVKIDNVVVSGQTYLLAAKIDFADGNDTVTLFLDPTPGLGNPDSASTIQLTNTDLGSFTQVALLGGFAGNNAQLDEIRVGSSFAEVTPATINSDPTLDNPVSNQNATEDSAFYFQFADNTFADADGNSLAYSAELSGGGTLPSWLSFDADTRSFSGTPLNADVGTITVEVTADDGKGGTPATDTFDITVGNTNDAPTVNATASDTGTEDTDQVYTHAEMLNLIGAADVDDVDADLNIVINNVVNGSVALSGGTGGDGTTFTFTPTADFVGDMTFDYQVSDDESPTPASSAVGTATVTLAADNDAPTLDNAISNQNATEDSAFNFTFAANTFSDIDGDSLSYTAQLPGGNPLPTWLDFDASTRTFSGTPDNGDVGTITIEVTADDSNGGTPASTTFNLQVINQNDAPSGSVIIDGELSIGSALSISHSLADDDGLGSITYQWQRDGVDITGATGGSYVLTSDDAGSNITVIASYTDGHGTAEQVISNSLTPTSGSFVTPDSGTGSDPVTEPESEPTTEAEEATETSEEVSEEAPEGSEPVIAADSSLLNETDDDSDEEAIAAELLRQQDGFSSVISSSVDNRPETNSLRIDFDDIGTAITETSLVSSFQHNFTPLSDPTLLVSTKDFIRGIDQLREEVANESRISKTMVGSTFAVSASMSAGYVVWLARSGVLLSGVLSALPAWRFIDPLPVLASAGTGGVEDDESLESLVEQKETDNNNEN